MYTYKTLITAILTFTSQILTRKELSLLRMKTKNDYWTKIKSIEYKIDSINEE